MMLHCLRRLVLYLRRASSNVRSRRLSACYGCALIVSVVCVLGGNFLVYFDGRLMLSTSRTRISFDNLPTDGLPIPLHLCRNARRMKYECKGDAYDAFKTKLRTFAENQYDSRPNWGRRIFPFPPNTTILAMGNSHTRQITGEILCQYHGYQNLKVVSRDKTGREQQFQIHYPNNSTLISITNHPFAYSRTWPERLTNLIGMPSLDSLDAIVLGKFNNFDESKNTNFMKDMVDATISMMDVDFEKVQPPRLQQLAQHYSGPILHVSMFSAFAQHEFQENLDSLQELKDTHNRTNLCALSSRRYVTPLGECGAKKNSKICFNVEPNVTVDRWNDASGMHRCVGDGGGHPDLIAWDVMETVQRLLSSDKNDCGD